jgi:hypothetical protein
VSIGKLIAVPAIITLIITILRLVGELQHWPAPWFNSAAGGGGAIIGISWLPIIFGPYFAWKLAMAGEGPASIGKAIGMCLVGLALFVVGAFLAFTGFSKHLTAVLVLGFAVQLVGAFVPRMGWRALGNTLLAYALAARIPVLIVMFIAMSANGGHGWGTHYDVVGPELANASFVQKFVYAAVVPQMTLWIAWTTVIGGLMGSIVVAVFHPGRHAAPAAA